MRPMKAPTFENAYLDRARRTSKKNSCRHKKLLIIRQYDTRLQPQHFLRQHAWRQQRVAQRTRSKEVEEFFYPQPQTKEELQQWLIDFFLGSSMKIRSIRGIPAVLRICMIGRRWCSINRSVSGKLNWQLVAIKQCYEYVWYVLEGVGVQADHS